LQQFVDLLEVWLEDHDTTNPSMRLSGFERVKGGGSNLPQTVATQAKQVLDDKLL